MNGAPPVLAVVMSPPTVPVVANSNAEPVERFEPRTQGSWPAAEPPVFERQP